MPLKRGDVPADIRLSRPQFPGDGGEASGLDHPGKAVHEEEIYPSERLEDIHAITHEYYAKLTDLSNSRRGGHCS